MVNLEEFSIKINSRSLGNRHVVGPHIPPGLRAYSALLCWSAALDVSSTVVRSNCMNFYLIKFLLFVWFIDPLVIGTVETEKGEDLGKVMVLPAPEDINRQPMKYSCESCSEVC